MTAAESASTSRSWIVLVSLVAGLIAAWMAALTPGPAGPDAPAADFSASRAMVDVRTMAARPHPSGSAEISRVRSHIVSRLTALGLSAEVQSGEGILTAAKRKPGVVVAGAVNNVIGVLPGRDRNAPAVLIMSHYDTMPATPGAGDDTAGVAASLEIARALSADGGRTRDVIFLFTDGEEPGLLGAQAFFASHPLARRLGVVINMEARGDAGRAAMFETSPDAGALIRLVAAKAPGPSANSLMAALYRVMPNDTDLTSALDHRVAGLNFAFAGDQLAYHTSLSTPDHLDPGSLQHMGGQVLPVARALAHAKALPERSPDLTYSDIMGRLLVAYPTWVGWLLSALAGGSVVAATVLVRRRGLASWSDLGRGAAGLVFSVLAAAVCLHLGGRWLGGEDSVRVYALLASYPLLLAGAAAVALGVGIGVVSAMAHGVRRLPLVAAAGLAGVACNVGGLDVPGTIVAALAMVFALLCLGPRTSGWGLWMGALILAAAMAVGLQAAAPTAAFLVQWPLLLAGLAALTLLSLGVEATSTRGLMILGVFAAAGFAQISAWANGFFLLMGPVAPELLALFVPLALLVLAPGLHAFGSGRAGRWLPVALLVFGGLLLALVGTGARMGAPPRPLTQLFYLADPAAGAFHRASATKTLDPWSRAALGGALVEVRMPLVSSGPIWLGPAAPVDIGGPLISAADSRRGAATHVVLRVRPTGGGRQLKLLIQPTRDLRNLSLNGRPLETLREAAAFSLDRIAVVYTAPPADGIEIAFDALAHGKVQVTALEFRDGWPDGDGPLPVRPKSLLTWGLSDSTVIQSTFNHSW